MTAADPVHTAHTVDRRRRALPRPRNVALAALGGAAGAVLRTAQSTAFPAEPGRLPWSTLVENLAGALALGFLLAVLIERRADASWTRPLLATGLLGAYTTYATVGLELHLLALDGAVGFALLYLTSTALLGLLAAGIGIALGRWATLRWTASR